MPPNPAILTEAERRWSEGEWKDPDAASLNHAASGSSYHSLRFALSQRRSPALYAAKTHASSAGFQSI